MGVFTGILYCRLSGRALYVDWRDGRLGDAGVNAFNTLFEIIGEIDWLQELPAEYERETVVPKAWQGRLHKSLHEVYVEDGNPVWDRAATVRRYSFDLGRMDYVEPVLVMWDFTQLDKLRSRLDPSIADLHMEGILRWVRRAHLKVCPEIDEEGRRQVPDTPGTIGVHVRLTDEAVSQKGYVALRDYFKAIDRIKKQVPVKAVVLATDNYRVEEAFRARYDNVVTRGKWYPAPGVPLHLEPSCLDRWQSTRDALVEARMLSLCDYLISQNNSAFSMMARILSDGDTGRQITLETRFPLKARFAGRLRRAFQR